MKRFVILALCLLPLASCNPTVVDPVAVKAAVTTQLESFPESRLQDLYKSFFQDRFGPGHIIKDRTSARDYILSELAEADTLIGPKTESCGWQGNYVRVNLSVIAGGQMTVDENGRKSRQLLRSIIRIFRTRTFSMKQCCAS